jgi:2-C-methyl-D-erythritol 4-phosphate cytidylyltransferase/2-C-methyl-D-erythritol 2,4-cyclodiphosphate synthase
MADFPAQTLLQKIPYFHALEAADLTLICQVPRLAPWKAQIRTAVAGLLRLPAGRVNVKATTEEGLGFTGEKKGSKAVACVSALLPG